MEIMQPRQILIVSDKRSADSFGRTLHQAGFDVAEGTYERASQELLESRFDLIVVDLDHGQGADFIRGVRKIVRLNGTPVLALGSWGTGQPTVALSAGADAFEPTPIDATRLADAVERILNKRAAVVGNG